MVITCFLLPFFVLLSFSSYPLSITFCVCMVFTDFLFPRFTLSPHFRIFEMLAFVLLFSCLFARFIFPHHKSARECVCVCVCFCVVILRFHKYNWLSLFLRFWIHEFCRLIDFFCLFRYKLFHTLFACVSFFRFFLFCFVHLLKEVFLVRVKTRLGKFEFSPSPVVNCDATVFVMSCLLSFCKVFKSLKKFFFYGFCVCFLLF